MKIPSRTVFVPNKSFHDFSDAERFGKIVFLTEGVVKRNNINHIYRELTEKMADAQEGDYLLVSSLGILNAVAASIMAYRFGRVNFLIYTAEGYVPREINLTEVLARSS